MTAGKGKRRLGSGLWERRGKTTVGWPALYVALALAVSSACALRASKQGVPSEVDSAVTTIGDDLAEGRYEKIYNEADDQWRQDSTLEQTTSVLVTLKDKLGKSKSRQLHTASEQNSSGGRVAGHSFVLTYETKFERGEGMETFTLVERNGQWLLARYLVNSTALQ
jgi:hypothetical protein